MTCAGVVASMVPPPSARGLITVASLFLVVASAGGLLGCSDIHEDDGLQQYAKAHLDLTVVVDESSDGFVVDLSTGPEGEIYILNARDNSVRRFNRDGHILGRSVQLKPPSGPLSLGYLEISDGGNVNVIFAAPDSLIYKLSADNDLLEAMDLGQSVQFAQFGRKGHLFAWSKLEGGIIRKFAEDDNDIIEIPLPSEKLSKKFDGLKFLLTNEGNLIIVHTYLNKIEMIDQEGKVISVISIDGLPDSVEYGNLVSPQTGTADLVSVPKGVMFSDVTQDVAGRIYVLDGDYGTLPRQIVYVVDLATKIVETISLAEKTMFIHFGRDGYFYMGTDRLRSFSRYRLIH